MKAAREAGLSREEIRLAVSEAEALRVEAARSVADYARQMLGDEEKHAQGLGDPGDRSQALVRVGAATGGNAGYLLDELLPQARGLCLTDDAVKEAIELASTVKKVAAEVFGKDADRALGREGEVAAAQEQGDCTPMAQAAAREAVESEPGTCC